ncbi:MAG: HAD family hydrolase [Actinomycetota bacterium]
MRALLVDYGGVMTTSIVESFAAFCAAEQLDVESFRAAVLGTARKPDSPFAKIETGAISPEEFDEAVARLLTDACGKPVAHARLKQRMFATVVPVQEMFDAVRTARANGVRTAVVSNSWGGRDYPLDELSSTFDSIVISGEIGLRKPEPEIYLHSARSLDVEPRDCVFVDDFRVNIEGAEAVGMTGVLHKDPAETIGRLEDRFGMSLHGVAR